ncbi:MAG TPA: hypothetical protein VGG48_15700 [Rhizomicrobium sp.]|jgi:hypothetical protein
MNLFYFIGSVAGIAVLVGLNVLLFGRRTSALDLAALERRLALDHPGFRAGDGVVAGGAALIEDRADGGLYLVRAGGAYPVARKLSHGSVRRLVRNGSRLDLRFADFTFPCARLAFASEVEAGDWEVRLKRVGG